MRATVRSFLFICSLALGPLAQAQDFFWDFEGLNGLDGWRMYNGDPLQTGQGAASTTSVRFETGPPIGTFDSSAFIYHVVPYDPTLSYNVTLWGQSPDPGISIRVYLGWLDTLSQHATLNAVNTNMFWSPNAGEWGGAEFLDQVPVAGWGAYCIIISASSAALGEVFIDNVSIEMIPPGSAMLRSPTLFLGGNFVSGNNQMSSQLSDQGLIPLTEPYTALGYAQVGGGGAEWCTPILVDPSFTHNAVDWVRLELRSAADPTVVVATRQLMLTRLGFTFGYNGQRTLHFDVPAGDYYMAVRHRNHHGAMTATPVTLPSTYPTNSVDFRSPLLATWGNDARKAVGASMVLWPGDVNGDGVIKYAGLDNDRDAVLVAIGGVNPLNVLTNMYDAHDTNLDGAVKYVGWYNDRDVILTSLNGVVLGIRNQQLP